MAGFSQLILVIILSGMFSSWPGNAYPVNTIQVKLSDPTFDMKGLNAVVTHDNCIYELVETSKTFTTDDDVEWYPQMRPVAKCITADCQLVRMNLLFLVKSKHSTTHNAYWGTWDVACTKSTSTPADPLVINRDSK